MAYLKGWTYNNFTLEFLLKDCQWYYLLYMYDGIYNNTLLNICIHHIFYSTQKCIYVLKSKLNFEIKSLFISFNFIYYVICFIYTRRIYCYYCYYILLLLI